MSSSPQTTTPEKLSFENWMLKIDELVMAKVEMSIYDLPDMAFMDSYEAGDSPQAFFNQYVMEHLEEMGWASDVEVGFLEALHED